MKAEQIVHKMEKMVFLAKLAIKTEDAQEEAEATKLLEQLEAEIQTICAQLPDWVSVTEALPEAEREVIIRCDRGGYIFACPAIYEDGTILRGESCWNWNDIEQYGLYSVEDDDYKIPAGWWENRHFTPDDVYNNPVDCAVTHWMPLPWRLVC